MPTIIARQAINHITRLGSAERVMIVRQIWDNVEESGFPHESPEVAQELERRAQVLAKGKAATKTWHADVYHDPAFECAWLSKAKRRDATLLKTVVGFFFKDALGASISS